MKYPPATHVAGGGSAGGRQHAEARFMEVAVEQNLVHVVGGRDREGVAAARGRHMLETRLQLESTKRASMRAYGAAAPAARTILQIRLQSSNYAGR